MSSCLHPHHLLQDLEDQATDALDLSGQTNESAGLEVAIECLRCSRVIGLVISNGDYEAALDCALTLGTPEVWTCLACLADLCV